MRVTASIAALILVVTTQSVAQTTVTPSSRVASRLNVREEPDRDSLEVGKLEKHETAELLDESISRWYKIRLHSGIEGFVSKSWSTKATAAPDPTQRVRLGGWNIKKLGHGSSTDFPLVANVIESNFDIVGVVEMMQKQGAHGGYDSLLQALGSGWGGIITTTPRPDTTSGNAEFYAVVYRKTDARPCSGWTALRYHSDNDGSASGTGADNFSREPAFGCFEAGLSNGSHGFDFILGVYHAVFDNVSTIQNEVQHIDSVFTSMAAAVAGERDLLIVGDFNLKPTQLAAMTNASDRTVGTGSTLNSTGAVTGNLYDHLLVHDESATTELVGNARVLDVRHVAVTNPIFFSTVSDHLPISIEVRTGGPDDD